MAYSSLINDPAFAQYLRRTKQWSIYFSLILAVIVIVSFFIYGQRSSEMDNPQAVFIGLGIGALFILIAVVQIISRNMSKTWDGTVIDKKQTLKKRKIDYDNTNSYQEYMEFTVVIKETNTGKLHVLAAENDDTVYNYYAVGDHVRHHKGLNSYEKWDKSKDSIVFCNACASLNDIHDEVCFRCSCPLLK